MVPERIHAKAHALSRGLRVASVLSLLAGSCGPVEVQPPPQEQDALQSRVALETPPLLSPVALPTDESPVVMTPLPTIEPTPSPPVGFGSYYETRWDDGREAWVFQDTHGSVAAQWNPEQRNWEMVLGGANIYIGFRDVEGEYRTNPPEVFLPYLTPTAPEDWDGLRTLRFNDGSLIPWGPIASMHVELVGRITMMPGLVRGVVQYGIFGQERGYPDGGRYGAIIEFPVPGGSAFMIYEIQERVRDLGYYNIMYPASGFPTQFAFRENTYQDFDGLLDGEPVNGLGMVEFLQQHKGQMILVLIEGGENRFEQAIIDGVPPRTPYYTDKYSVWWELWYPTPQ